MDAFDKFRGRVTQFKEQRKISSDIAENERLAAADPTNIGPLLRLADLYASVGRVDDAIGMYTNAAEVSRSAKRIEAALGYYRKAERLATADRRVQLLRRMIPLLQENNDFDDLFQVAREAIEFYLANGTPEVAIGFLKSLPPLGTRDGVYRNQLTNLVHGHTGTWAQEATGSWKGGNAAVPGTENFSSLLILLVDDDPMQLKLYTRSLETLGCTLTTAINGVEALERIAERRPNLIVCDLVMPRMDGRQLFEKLQQDPATEIIPFVCLSAQTEEIELVSALDRGIEDYWTKPIRAKEFRARAKRILRRVKEYSTLSGSLAEMSVPDLLQILDTNARTGSLILETGGGSGTVYFVDGRPIDAVVGDTVGEAAIYWMLHWRDGKFQFSPKLPERRPRIFGSTQGIILEALRRYDEAQEVMAQLPNDPEIRLSFTLKWIDDTELPEDAKASDLDRLRELLDGTRTLKKISEELQHGLEPLRLLLALYKSGHVKEIGSRSSSDDQPPDSDAPRDPWTRFQK